MKSRIFFIGLSILGALLILFFGIRALHAFRKFEGHPPHPSFEHGATPSTDDIEDWMTIPFIAHVFGVPPNVLFDAINISEQGNFHKSLAQLNEEYYPDKKGYVMEIVKATVLAHQPPPAAATPPQPPSAP